MKPVPKEDRVKLIGLVIGLVIALGFVGNTVLGMLGSQHPRPPVSTSPPPSPGLAAGPSATSPAIPPPAMTIPGAVAAASGDPFRKVIPTGPPTQPPPASHSSGTPTKLMGRLPAATAQGERTIGGSPGEAGSLAPVSPPAPASLRVHLDGIWLDREAIAMISVGGRTEELKVGQEASNGYRVVAIDEDDVTFQKGSDRVRLAVGETMKGSTELPGPSLTLRGE